MAKNQNNPDSSQLDQNQNNEMSDDPKDGSRNSETLGEAGGSAKSRPPKNDEQDQSVIEAFGEEGAGVAAKE